MHRIIRTVSFGAWVGIACACALTATSTASEDIGEEVLDIDRETRHFLSVRCR